MGAFTSVEVGGTFPVVATGFTGVPAALPHAVARTTMLEIVKVAQNLCGWKVEVFSLFNM
jgi:hypothetical protein